ncbi:MAG TPA: hypothetical protein VM121_07285 [Acidimicrobiales bacterium]|nr:hypothetical protein [Acidimicrobiales bacterium]
MTTPSLRAEMESGAVWDDPSEDLLYDLLGDVERGDEQFMVVERTSDPSGQTYLQAILGDSGGWILERRDGGPDAHYRASSAELRTVHAAVTAWAFELPDWANAVFWQKTRV